MVRIYAHDVVWILELTLGRNSGMEIGECALV